MVAREGADAGPVSGKWNLWVGDHASELQREGLYCAGEVDLVQGRWYCGHGGYMSQGSASRYGTVSVTDADGLVFAYHGDEDAWFSKVPQCASSPTVLEVPDGGDLGVAVTEMRDCGGWVLTQPWVELVPPGEPPR